MTITLEGFHGTDNALVDSILSNGLRPSLGDKEWLGDGGYFFVQGINLEPENKQNNGLLLVLGIIEQKRTNTYHMLFYVE